MMFWKNLGQDALIEEYCCDAYLRHLSLDIRVMGH
jgi:hypothetical protein